MLNECPLAENTTYIDINPVRRNRTIVCLFRSRRSMDSGISV